MKLEVNEVLDFESVMSGKTEIIRLLTDPTANDYEDAEDEKVQGWFINLANLLISYSIKEHDLRKELSEKYGLPYSFLYKDGEIFTAEDCPFRQDI